MPDVAGDSGGDGLGGAGSSAEQVARERERLASMARGGAERLADEQKAASAVYLRALAAAVNSGAYELQRQGFRDAASIATEMGNQVDTFAATVAERSPAELLGEMESFARRHPALWLAGAAAVGFAATRFLRSAAHRDPEQYGARNPGAGSAARETGDRS